MIITQCYSLRSCGNKYQNKENDSNEKNDATKNDPIIKMKLLNIQKTDGKTLLTTKRCIDKRSFSRKRK